MIQGYFKDLSAYNKLILMLLFVVCGLIIGSIITLLVGQYIFHIDLSVEGALKANIPFLQGAQIFQSICIFVLPSALATYALYPNNRTVMPGQGRSNAILIVLTILVIFFSQAFITWTGWLNQQLALPEALESVASWIKNKEIEAKELTDLMIQSATFTQIIITVFMLCVLPAIGEEWLFRGLIQKELASVFRNVHIAVFITAFVFSAIHLQFLSFLPRFALGIILGYLMVFSKNIWIPIAAHFVNNLMAVILYSYHQNHGSNNSIFEMPSENPFGLMVVYSLVLIIILLYSVKQLAKHNTRSNL
ncbi:lysostaphin resistance A-like protein [Carboxylicivirga sp. N1Y90]|uniref:CPBP family intramembrane glutamic endopeptidase n=1 Tax=Carboxylicivirga fragile TaxID=3417571 RepID=UPI003D351F24|nr:CPBP family intramembrane metalloprotease [Marinilabiliaceae bacterium N1Y90]